MLASLTLFPPHSLDTSILAAVLVGVLLLAFLTETFGWVFVGLVVPGYLASVFVIHPEAGLTVSMEAIITYLLAVLLSRGISATGAWSDFFGRERFFLLVIASVLVRAVSEVILLPRIGAYLDLHYGTTFTLDRALHSIGLVLVPLTANSFWKVGLRRGLFQVGMVVGLTWAILNFVLLPYTNLSFSSLELTYEDVAQRFLASPKAYILLLTTAVIAARYNLRYGWDFNGILVAALVGLTWLGPSKTLATVCEVLVLVFATKALLKIPGIKTFNLEGPRKTVVVFVLGFLIKFAIGWAIGGRVPGLKVTDLFGFGYLVPTLVAVKILQKDVVARVLLPTIHTSLVGVVVGSLIGFPLSLLEPKLAQAAYAEDPIASSVGLNRTPLGVMALARATVRENDARFAPIRRRRSELRDYAELWKAADAWLDSGDGRALAQVRTQADALDLELERLDPDARGHERFALVERYGQGGLNGWGTTILVPGAKGPVLEVPRPASEAPTAESAALLCERVDCRAILVSGMDTRSAGLTRGDALVDRNTPLQTAHDVLSRRERIQLRADPALPHGTPVIYARGGGDPNDAALRSLWPGAVERNDAPADPGVNWGEERVSILVAHPDDLVSLVADTAPKDDLTWQEADIAQWIQSHAPRSARSWEPLSPAELIVLQDQVASPLLVGTDDLRARDLKVRWASAMAALFGMKVKEIPDCNRDARTRCYAVTEPEPGRGQVGAALLVRNGTAAPLALEVPAPSRERGTLALGFELWRTGHARALVFTDPFAVPEPAKGDPTAPGEVFTGLQAFHQALQQAVPADGGLVLQIRGHSGRPGVSDDAIVVLDAPVASEAQRPPELVNLFADNPLLKALEGRTRYYDGAAELAGLTTPTPQQAYARAFGGARFASLWFSDGVRSAFISPDDIDESLAYSHLTPLPLSARDAALDAEAVDLQPSARPASRALEQRFKVLSDRIARAVIQRNVHDLRALVQPTSSGTRGVDAVRIYRSRSSGLPYAVVEAREGRHVLRGVYFLQDALWLGEPARVKAGDPATTAIVADALVRRSPVWVEGDVGEGNGR